MLTLGWSDGVNFLPLDFALLSSAKASKRVQGITKKLDKRTCGYKRRIEAMTKSTNLLETMVKRVLCAGLRVDYILMDSWFCFPVILAKLGQHVPVICMTKDMKTILYSYKGQRVRLSKLYKLLKKRPGKATLLASGLHQRGLLARLEPLRRERAQAAAPTITAAVIALIAELD